MATTNITGSGPQTKTFERLICSPVWEVNNNIPFHSQQSTFSSQQQQLLQTLLSLLPFTKNLPSIRHPNSCIVVWQHLICWLVLLTILSMLPIGCPWLTNTGVFVDTRGTQATYQALHCVEFLCLQRRP